MSSYIKIECPHCGSKKTCFEFDIFNEEFSKFIPELVCDMCSKKFEAEIHVTVSTDGVVK